MCNLINTINHACANVRSMEELSEEDLYSTPEWQTWRELVLNGSLAKAIRMVRGQDVINTKYVYALTIAPGPISGPDFVKLMQRVYLLKAFNKSDVRYSYECYDEERKLTHPHMHALVCSDKYISVKDVRKTTKCMTDMRRLRGPAINKWKNYIAKDNNHEPTRAHFIKLGIIDPEGPGDNEHYGHWSEFISD